MLSKKNVVFFITLTLSITIYFFSDYYKSDLKNNLSKQILQEQFDVLEAIYDKEMIKHSLYLQNFKKEFLEQYTLEQLLQEKRSHNSDLPSNENFLISIYDNEYNLVKTNISLEHQTKINKKQLEYKLESIIKEKTELKSNDVGLFYNLYYPLYKDDIKKGVLLIQYGFNQVATNLQNNDLNMILLLNENDSKNIYINSAYSKNFINSYYVVNDSLNKFYLKLLEEHYDDIRSDRHISSEAIILRKTLFSGNNEIATTYILKSNDMIDMSILQKIEFYLSLLTIITIVLIFVLALFIIEYGFIKQFKIENKQLLDQNEKLKISADKLDYNEKKLSNLFNLQPNIMFISNGMKIVQVNKRFMGFFRQYETLENFQLEHKDISELFEPTIQSNYLTGYLVEDIYWLEYILQNPKKLYKCIMSIEGEQHHFIIKVNEMTYVKKLQERYIVVAFVDITQELEYRNKDNKKLEELNETDLTYLLEDSLSITVRELTNIIPTRNSMLKAQKSEFQNGGFVANSILIETKQETLQWNLYISALNLDYIQKCMQSDWHSELDDKITQDKLDMAKELSEQFMNTLQESIKLHQFKEFDKLMISIENTSRYISNPVDEKNLYRVNMHLENRNIEVYIEFNDATLPYIKQLYMLGVLI